MTKVTTLTACGLLLLAASAAPMQESPYRDHQQREIKALSEDDIEQYRQGAGMGFALAAELNGYPGPKHVLELAEELALEPQQRTAVEVIFGRMHRDAVSLGEEVVRRERELDRAFADGSIEASRLGERVAEIARTRGELRTVHLAAHLEMRGVLTPAQRARYAELRGYGASHVQGLHDEHAH